MALPSQFGYGKVTGGFQLAVGDSDDPDRTPDARPAEGTVLFRPQATRIVIPGERIVTPKPIECSLDADGYLYLPGSVLPDPETGLVPEEDRGVWLVANDTPDASPQGWTYEVLVSLTGQAQWKFPIAVTTDSEQDLSAIVPVSPSGGTPIIRGPGIHTIDGRNYQAIACAIRNTGAGFELIQDENHTPVGVSHVTANPNGDIVVHYDFTGKSVAGVIATPDETFAAQGYTLGTSVTATETRIRVARTAIWADYISYSATNGWSSYNGLAASIAPSIKVSHQADGWFYYAFNEDVDIATPMFGGSISSRTDRYTAYLESPAGHHREDYPGTHGGFFFRFVDNTTGERVPNTAPTTDMQVWVMINWPLSRKIMPDELVSTSGNIWIHGMIEID